MLVDLRCCKLICVCSHAVRHMLTYQSPSGRRRHLAPASLVLRSTGRKLAEWWFKWFGRSCMLSWTAEIFTASVSSWTSSDSILRDLDMNHSRAWCLAFNATLILLMMQMDLWLHDSCMTTVSNGYQIGMLQVGRHCVMESWLAVFLWWLHFWRPEQMPMIASPKRRGVPTSPESFRFCPSRLFTTATKSRRSSWQGVPTSMLAVQTLLLLWLGQPLVATRLQFASFWKQRQIRSLGVSQIHHLSKQRVLRAAQQSWGRCCSCVCREVCDLVCTWLWLWAWIKKVTLFLAWLKPQLTSMSSCTFLWPKQSGGDFWRCFTRLIMWAPQHWLPWPTIILVQLPWSLQHLQESLSAFPSC